MRKRQMNNVNNNIFSSLNNIITSIFSSLYSYTQAATASHQGGVTVCDLLA